MVIGSLFLFLHARFVLLCMFQDAVIADFGWCSALQVWKPDQVKCSIAVTSDSNKAFIYWASHGEQTDTHQENHFYGLNLLVFNEKCVVTEILGFRQPLASERPQFLKADAKAAAK